MESDIWTGDPEPAVARIEAGFSDALLNFLYRVHLDAHQQLGLPGIKPAEVAAAYRLDAGQMAKAGGWSKAKQLFEELLAMPRRARDARRMAQALTEDWAERGLIEDAGRKAIVQANVIGAIEAGHDPERVYGWRKQAQSIVEPRQEAAFFYGMERAAEHVTRLKDTTRATLSGAITDALMRNDSPQTLATDLVQRFGTLNRDARRLAITEVAFARANGFLAQSVGKRVEWFAAADACPHCQKLDGREFDVVAGPGNPETEVWPGKHTVGLNTEQRQQAPAIPLHPSCRCRWVLVGPKKIDGVSDRLLAALAALEQD